MELCGGKSKRNRKCNKWRRKRRPDLWENYTSARNDNVQLCREGERNCEKDIVEKCKDQPKMFFQFLNSKLKDKEGISKLEVNEVEYMKPTQMPELMNEFSGSVH